MTRMRSPLGGAKAGDLPIVKGAGRLWKILVLTWRTSPPMTAGMLVLSVVSGFLPLLTALSAGFLVNASVPAASHGSLHPLYGPILFQLGLMWLTRICFSLYASWVPLLSEMVANRLQEMLLDKVNSLDLITLEDPEFAELWNRISRDVVIRPIMMVNQLFQVIRSAIALVTILDLLSGLHWWLSVLVFLGPIPSFIAEARYATKQHDLTTMQMSRSQRSAYFSSVISTADSAREIRLLNLQNFFIDQFHDLGRGMVSESRRLHASKSRAVLCMSLPSTAVNALAYLVVASGVTSGRLAIGALVQYSAAIVQIGSNVQVGLESLAQLHEHDLFMVRVLDFMALTPSIAAPKRPDSLPDTRDAVGSLLEFRDVSFSYPTGKGRVLDGISFSVAPGEKVALVGVNGAGKSTIVKLLTRLYEVDSGRVSLLGRDVREYDPDVLREHIRVFSQDFVRLSMTAADNVGVGWVEHIRDRKAIESAAEEAGATNIVEGLAESWDTPLGRFLPRGVELSGGQWQKIALARTLVRKPPLLVLDEPTSAMDARAERDTFHRLLALENDQAILFISHRLSTASMADRILVIDEGHIVEEGSHAQLMATSTMYRELFTMQAQPYLDTSPVDSVEAATGAGASGTC